MLTWRFLFTVLFAGVGAGRDLWAQLGVRVLVLHDHCSQILVCQIVFAFAFEHIARVVVLEHSLFEIKVPLNHVTRLAHKVSVAHGEYAYNLHCAHDFDLTVVCVCYSEGVPLCVEERDRTDLFFHVPVVDSL